MSENIQFFLKVVFAHVFTYTLCGAVYSKINKYKGWIQKQDTWRSPDSLIYKFVPLIQIIRGVLFGIVFLPLRNTVVYAEFGILWVFLMVVILGIINTPAPSPGSIEGAIYLKPVKTPLNVALGGMIEMLTQILLFSIIISIRWLDLIR